MAFDVTGGWVGGRGWGWVWAQQPEVWSRYQWALRGTAAPAGSGGSALLCPTPAPALFTFLVAGWGIFHCIFTNTVIWEMCNSALIILKGLF